MDARKKMVDIIENAYWRGYYQATGEVTIRTLEVAEVAS